MNVVIADRIHKRNKFATTSLCKHLQSLSLYMSFISICAYYNNFLCSLANITITILFIVSVYKQNLPQYIFRLIKMYTKKKILGLVFLYRRDVNTR
jgi:uncharacterized membrane protein (DUF485 family)